MLNLTCQRLRAICPDWLNVANCFVTAGPLEDITALRNWMCVFYGGSGFEREGGGNLGRRWRMGLAYYYALTLDETDRHTLQTMDLNERMRQVVGDVTYNDGPTGLHLWQPLLAVLTGFQQTAPHRLLPDRTVTGGGNTAQVLDVRVTSGSWAAGTAEGDVILATDLADSWASAGPVTLNMAAYRAAPAISSVARLSGSVSYVQLAVQPVVIKSEQAPRVVRAEGSDYIVSVQQEYEVVSLVG